MPGINEEDHARGARVEIAIRAAQKGDHALAAGILAGMSAEERDAVGPLVAAAARQPGPDRGRWPRPDPFGNTALDRAERGPR